ncbi:MAG: hypothetical protein VKK98_08145 [Cyanobacteriota bacterium]|nr:hypothetical protein [Cyanobacteriota bacterium]
MRAARLPRNGSPSIRPAPLSGRSLHAVPDPQHQRAGISGLAPAADLSQERRELICSGIGLTVKLSIALLAGVSLVQLARAYQERMDRHGELTAVLELEQSKLRRSRDRFDRLFRVDGEQTLLREQNQWIAPDRLRVVWHGEASSPASPRP